LIGFDNVSLTLLTVTALTEFVEVSFTLLQVATSVRLKLAKTIVQVLRFAIFIMIFDNVFFIFGFDFSDFLTVFNLFLSLVLSINGRCPGKDLNLEIM